MFLVSSLRSLSFMRQGTPGGQQLCPFISASPASYFVDTAEKNEEFLNPGFPALFLLT